MSGICRSTEGTMASPFTSSGGNTRRSGCLLWQVGFLAQSCSTISNQIFPLQSIATPDHRCTRPSLVFSCFFIFSISSLTETIGYLGNVPVRLFSSSLQQINTFRLTQQRMEFQLLAEGPHYTFEPLEWTSSRRVDFYVFIDRINTNYKIPGNKEK